MVQPIRAGEVFNTGGIFITLGKILSVAMLDGWRGGKPRSIALPLYRYLLQV